MARISNVVTGVCGAGEVRWPYAMPVSVLFVPSTSGIDVNPSADTLTDHSQSAKDIDSYFKSQLYVVDPATERRYSFYRMGRVNPESERTTEIKFPPWVGFEPTTS